MPQPKPRQLLLLVMLLLSSCQVARFVYYNFADIQDHKIFLARSLHKPTDVFEFPVSAVGLHPKSASDKNSGEMTFEAYLEKHNTVAFLIIKNDSIQYEKYFNGYEKASIVPSFSMAKSVTSILLGCAIAEGLIPSVNEPITNYIPELQKKGFEKVTILHLLQMTSGIKFNESYVNPFGHAAAFYYGKNLRKQLGKLKLAHEPGKKFNYVSGDTQLLGLVLERALKGKSLTQYLQEKLWTPLGMEYDASWSLDQEKEGMEKTFCCLNARARDYAKIGRLYLNKGNWNGQQLVPADWVTTSTQFDTTGGSAGYYQYQWWLPLPIGAFMAEGILGQYIFVYPEKNLIIVRLGKNEGKTSWRSIFNSLATAY